MLPWVTVDRSATPGCPELVLARRGDEWAVRSGGRVLVASRAHGSEEALAALALERVDRPRRVLIGGLGLGYTLRATLDRLPPHATVAVAEISEALVAWNRGPVAHLARRPLEDRRVTLRIGDVAASIASSRRALDAILLDVDNGPAPLSHPENGRLYGPEGLRTCLAALRPGGVLAVWSARSDARFLARLARAGFEARARAARAGDARHVVFLAQVPGPPLARPARRGPRASGDGPRPVHRP